MTGQDRRRDAHRARHDVVNTLVRYLRAVDDHDLDGVVAELADAAVSFGGPPLRGVGELSDAYRSAFAAGGRSRHLLHEVEVEVAEDETGVVGRAGYQRWSLDADPPVITALGDYRARFVLHDTRWRLVELTVRRDWQHS